MTLRRLLVLVRALPAEATVWAAQAQAERDALKPTVEQIRARAAHYKQRAEEAE